MKTCLVFVAVLLIFASADAFRRKPNSARGHGNNGSNHASNDQQNSANSHHGNGQNIEQNNQQKPASRWAGVKRSPWSKFLNESWTESIANANDFESLKATNETFSTEFGACEAVKQYTRHQTVVVKIKCGESYKYVEYVIRKQRPDVERLSDAEAQEILPHHRPGDTHMTGAWGHTSDSECTSIALDAEAEDPREDCTYDDSLCFQQVVRGLQVVVRQNCGEDTPNEKPFIKMYHDALKQPSYELVAVTDSAPKNLDKLCPMKARKMINESINAEALLKTHCEFQSHPPILLNTTFASLPTGTQYGIMVKDKETGMESCLGIFKFDFEGTVPVVVALPFMTYDECMGFLTTVLSMY